MRALRIACLVCALLAGMASVVLAEGFALNEWSARGVSLAGGMVGRADDVSALAYNAAGITQLPGAHVMGGLAFIAPMGTIIAEKGGLEHDTTTKPSVWLAPHAYASYQLNDNVWLGLGVFSRFGVGNSYDGGWTGRYNIYDVGLQSVSFVPTVAYKINDIFSVSLGVEALYASVYMGSKIPTSTGGPVWDNDLQVQGQGWGVGAHLGLHMRLNEQWSVGLAYKSQVTLNVNGDAEFGRQGPNLLTRMAHLPEARDCSANATVQLPDSLALGVAYKPLDNLSFEVGAIWTRWSTYNALNLYLDSGYSSISNKEWRDGWNFNASVEYKPLDWWSLRAGFAYETPVLNENHADFMMPTSGRTTLSLGTGVRRNDWTLDFAYAHLWINPTDYDRTDAAGIRNNPFNGGFTGGHSENVVANIYMFSVGYTF
ncbi:OmpP1/FadL family transporter [uncultured Desulfovibrio sp.]|uniref:OmpP1/FadL family transporter n=5 Tax=uncultured Desulfovibrio sp. TaxID=167968 RepID=UPI00272DAB6C|nr:outer membrane protein transport protein [uncultured Desulfovibrio sp.]